jgi:hypothetical protein
VEIDSGKVIVSSQKIYWLINFASASFKRGFFSSCRKALPDSATVHNFNLFMCTLEWHFHSFGLHGCVTQIDYFQKRCWLRHLLLSLVHFYLEQIIGVNADKFHFLFCSKCFNTLKDIFCHFFEDSLFIISSSLGVNSVHGGYVNVNPTDHL